MAYQYTPNVYGSYDTKKSFEENKTNNAVLTKEKLDRLEDQVKKNSADITVEVVNGEPSESTVSFDDAQGVRKITVKIPEQETVDAYTKSEVDEKVSGLINGAPETADTLKELADLISENEDAVGLLNAAIGNKANKATTLAGYEISDAYTKEEVDEKIPNVSGKADKATTLEGYGITDAYTKSEVDGKIPDISGKADSENVYTKEEVDEKIPDVSDKADKATTLAGYGIEDAYTKTEVDGKIPNIENKADKATTLAGYNISDAYTKSEVDGKIPDISGKADKSTTLQGYGITDAYTKTEVDEKIPDISGKADKSTTLQGYGITDAYTKTEVDEKIPDISGKANASDVYTKEEVDGKIPNVNNKADKATNLSGYGITDAYTKTEVDTKLKAFATLPTSWYNVEAEIIPEGLLSGHPSDLFDVDPSNGVFQKVVLHKNASIGKIVNEDETQKIVEKLPDLSAEHPLLVLQVESGDDTEGVIFTSYSFYFDLFRKISTREDGVPIVAIMYWDGSTTQLAVPFGAQFAYEDAVSSGTTAQRPVIARAGQMYFDTDLGKPVFYTGSKWVDATGVDA